MISAKAPLPRGEGWYVPHDDPQAAPSQHPARDHARGLEIVRLVLLCLALALAGCMAFAVASASAQLNELTAFGSPGSGAGQFSSPQGVAIDQSTGDVYVVDAGSFRVEKFDSSGNFVLAFGQGVDETTGGDVCAAATADTCGPGTRGSDPGEFSAPLFIAVDNSSGPSSGDVYVGDTGDDAISKFDSSGALIGSWASNGQLNGSSTFTSIDGIAVDPSGNLFVINDGNSVYEFGQDGAPVTNFATTRGMSPNGLAIGTSGHLFKVNGDGSVEELTNAGDDIGTVAGDGGDTGSATEIATDPATGNLYVDAGNSIGEFDFDSSGDVLEAGGSPCAVTPEVGCNASDEFTGTPNGSGLAFNPTLTLTRAAGPGTLYVADTQNNDVAVFVEPEPAAPSVLPNSESAANITPNTATLNASVNPDGLDTKYYFEYVDDADYDRSAPDPYSAGTQVPLPPGTDIGSAFAAQQLSVNLTALTQSTKYHFRMVASNSMGATDGPDAIFTTATTTAPSVDAQSSASITSDTATLNAQINPNFADTTYYFEYVDNAHYNASAADPYSAGTKIPPPPGTDIGSSDTDQTATANIAELTGGTLYHWRTVVVNAVGTTDGADQTFTTATPMAPSVDAESISNLTPTSATLNAQINPNFADTTYYFEYVDNADFRPLASDPYKAGTKTPPPPGTDIGSENIDQAASATATLIAGENYDYRVVAINKLGTTYGPNRTFTAIASVTLQGAFGQATINVAQPSLSDLRLRNPDGSLPGASMINAAATTLNNSVTGQGYSSSSANASKVVVSRDSHGGVTAVTMDDIDEIPGVETESWHFALGDHGATLEWTVTRHWLAAFTGTDDPYLGISFPSDIVGLMWYDPSNMSAPTWDSAPDGEVYSTDNSEMVTDRNTWLIEKLWSDRHLQDDIGMQVDGGYLTRQYGFTGQLVLGATPDQGALTAKPGTSQTISLSLGGVSKYSTGEQLDVNIPDPSTESSLRDMYESVLNGGSIAGQKGYLFGNEDAGIMSPYGDLFDSIALSVGVNAPGAVSAKPHTVAQAMRGYLQTLWDSVGPANGDAASLLYGISGQAGGGYQDAEYEAVIGTYEYTVYSGDLSLLKQNLPTMRLAMARWISRIQPNGLVLSDQSDGEYYDGVFFGNTSYQLYANDFVYEALKDMAALERALAGSSAGAGQARQLRSEAAYYVKTAAGIKHAINTVLWSPNGPYGPMYIDWIDNDNGSDNYYFDPEGQYPAIMFGIASPTQARETLQTADQRLQSSDLTSAGYVGNCTPSSLWPDDNADFPPWPYYMDGGCFTADSYYEIMARAVAGDAGGAYDRLQRFAADFGSTSYWGNNNESIGGVVSCCGEPYLEDMVVVAASLVKGVMGINVGWNGIRVTPHLPPHWRTASATVTYRGRLFCVTITSGARSEVTTKPGLCRASGKT